MRGQSVNLAGILHPFSRVDKVIAVTLALAACVFITSLTKAAAVTQTVNASASSGDTEIRSANPTTNYGSATTITVDGDEPAGTGRNTGTLIRFSLPTLPAGVTITDTKLRLNVTNSTTNTYNVFVMKKAWVESQATWNIYRTGSAWELAGGRGTTDRESTAIATITPSVTGIRDFDLGARFDQQVGEWMRGAEVNNGIQLINTGAWDGFDFTTRESATASLRPQLIITYSDGSVADTTPPDTAIDSGPSATVSSTSASFSFTSNEPGTFECQLDLGSWSACTSPTTYSGLANGSHTFSVRATDNAGNVDVTPATRTWTIDTTLPPLPGKLAWAPPVLTNPITVDVPANDTRYGNGVTKVMLASGQDARINLPSTTKVGGLWIEGGRNVIVIGGHIQPNPNHTTVSGALGMRGIYVKNNTGVVHIEGVLIDSPDDREYDAMEIDSGGTTLQLQNNRWLKVAGTSSTNHGDVLQPFGTGVRAVRIDKLTASSRYQGLQLYDQYNGPVTAKRVDLTARPQISGTSGGHMVWVGDDSCGQLSPYSFSEVYVRPRPDRTLGDSIWPTSGADASTCPAQLLNGFASWPLFPAITGGVSLGPPPGGEFVPVGAAGLYYVSPGYQQ
jgi:hypothetical protein